MLKVFLRKIRRFLQAEVMDELSLLRAEIRQSNELAQQMEAALLSLALLKDDKA